jgi:hypothetical protein
LQAQHAHYTAAAAQMNASTLHSTAVRDTSGALARVLINVQRATAWPQHFDHTSSSALHVIHLIMLPVTTTLPPQLHQLTACNIRNLHATFEICMQHFEIA